jgi:hypothetical protein
MSGFRIINLLLDWLATLGVMPNSFVESRLLRRGHTKQGLEIGYEHYYKYHPGDLLYSYSGWLIWQLEIDRGARHD